MKQKFSVFVYSLEWMIPMGCFSLVTAVLCIIGHQPLLFLLNAFMVCFWGFLIRLVWQEKRQQRKDGHNEFASKVG